MNTIHLYEMYTNPGYGRNNLVGMPQWVSIYGTDEEAKKEIEEMESNGWYQ